MRTRLSALAALLALLGAGTVQAQTTPAPAAANMVGRWLHDPQGEVIGSVRGLTDGGRTAVLMIGNYFQPGSYEAKVPASALRLAGGQVTLGTETAETLRILAQR